MDMALDDIPVSGCTCFSTCDGRGLSVSRRWAAQQSLAPSMASGLTMASLRAGVLTSQQTVVNEATIVATFHLVNIYLVALDGLPGTLLSARFRSAYLGHGFLGRLLLCFWCHEVI